MNHIEMTKDAPPWLDSPIFRDSPRNKLLVVENMELDASERGEKHSVDGKTRPFVESYLDVHGSDRK